MGTANRRRRGGEIVMSLGTVNCLHARARIVDAAPEVGRARAHAARGEVAWQRRLRRYEQGDTLIVDLTAFAVVDSDGEPPESLCFCHEALWIDRPIKPTVLLERLRSLTRRDFQPVGARLRDRGIQLAASEDTMPVALLIDSAVAQAPQPDSDSVPPSAGAACSPRQGC